MWNQKYVRPDVLGVVTCVAVVVMAAFASAAETRSDKPNVVMIISDDQAWTDFGFMGHKTIKTPHLDRLASQSALFTRGYVPGSLCRPSLATLITGLYSHQHKISGNDPPRGTDRNLMLRHIRRDPTLPKMLGTRGYRSLQTGKWWEGNYKEGGFTHGMTHGDTRRGGRHGDLGLKIGRTGMKPIFDFIEESKDQPFFIWYAPFLPHSPHNPPERLLSKYRAEGKSIHIARYQAMCEWFDETCGQLLDHLDEKKLADNTIVVFVTDNGWIQRTDSGRYAPRSKRSPYDGGIRTPIMVRWPGVVKPVRNETLLVNSIDLVPTILAACGMKQTEQMSGINLIDAAAGKPVGRKTIYGEIFAHDIADIDHPARSLEYRWCIEGPWKLILPAGGKNPELYDVVSDPMERKNLASDQFDTVTRLTSSINRWWSP